jgi:hypothetical protein
MTGKTTGKKRMTIRLSDVNAARIELIALAYGANENAVVNAAIWMLAVQAGLPNESDATPML